MFKQGAKCGFILLFLLFCLTAISCDLSLDNAKGESSARPSITLKWPDGYNYNISRLKSSVTGDRARALNRVTLFILPASGEDEIVLDVPLDSLSVNATIKLGAHTFLVEVVAEDGAMFTGETNVNVTLNTANIVIEVEVNSPPLIVDIITSNFSPVVGEIIDLEVIFEDPDPEDAHTFEWFASGGELIGNGPVVRWSTRIVGDYIIRVVVGDGAGGYDDFEIEIFMGGLEPDVFAIKISGSATPVIGDVVELICEAMDPRAEALTYEWHDNFGWSGSGQPVFYTVTQLIGVEITCVATNESGLSGMFTEFANAGKLPGPTNILTAQGTQGRVNITWDSVAGATGYDLFYKIGFAGVDYNSNGVPNINVNGYTHDCSTSQGSLIYYRSAAIQVDGNLGQLSAEAVATCPGVLPPDSMSMGTTIGGQIDVTYNNSMPMANSYNICFDCQVSVPTTPNSCAPSSSLGITTSPGTIFCTPGNACLVSMESIGGTYTSSLTTAQSVTCP